MKIFVIIVTYNPIKWVDKCFESLVNSSMPLRVIVVDNGSTDGGPELIKNKFPEVDFIQSKENLGFGKANNIGIKKALSKGADFIFLLNQDAWVETDTIEGLINFMNSNKDYGIVSPLHYSGNLKDYDQGFLHFCSENEIMNSIEKNKQYIEVKSINGAFMMLSKKCIELLKGFDPIFQFYGEDVDLCSRAKRRGYKIGVLNRYKAFHDRGERQMTNQRLLNHFIANHLIQIKENKNEVFFLDFIKTIYSSIYSSSMNLIKLRFDLSLLYIKVIFFLIQNYSKLKKSRLIYD